jgi:outer membrane protein TolC
MHTFISLTNIGCGAFAATCLSFLCTFAQGETLELFEAIKRAESSNPGLQALRERLTAADELVGSAGTLSDPTFQFTYFGESVQTRTGPQEAIYSISQAVPWLSKLEVQKALAVSQAEELSQIYRRVGLNLRRDVTKHFVEVDYIARAIESTETHIRLVDRMRTIAEEQVRGGGSLNTLLRLEVEWERVDDHLQKLRQEHYAERCKLAALLSLEENILGEVQMADTEFNSYQNKERLATRLLSKNPELLALRQHTASAVRQVKLARLDRYPDFKFGLNYIQTDKSSIPTSDSGKDPWNVTVSVSLPVWKTKIRSEVRASIAQKRSIEQTLQAREEELTAELLTEIAAYKDNRARLQRYRDKLIPLAEQALENSRTAYESNQLSALEWIDSERVLLDLKLSFWRAKANLRQSAAVIESLMGEE